MATKVFGDNATTSASGSGIPGRFRFFFGGGTVIVCGVPWLPKEETLLIVSSPEALDTVILDKFSPPTILFLSETSS